MYDKDILQVLVEAGYRGISVRAVARHVYNRNCSLFVQPDFMEVHRQVQQYLLRQSKSRSSLVVRTERRGVYRLNTSNADAQQLMLDFRVYQEEQEELKEEKPQEDLSLNLFDF